MRTLEFQVVERPIFRGSMDTKHIDLGDGATLHVATNAIGIPRDRLNKSTGRPKGARNLHAKHPSSLARRFKKAGLDWADAFAKAIKAAGDYTSAPTIRRQAREDVRMWLRLLPYMITTTNKIKVKRWKGKASKAALIALEALEDK